MASTDDLRTMSTDTAEALLTAIKEAAPDADGRSSDGLKNLAEAYAAVSAAMPKGQARGSVGM